MPSKVMVVDDEPATLQLIDFLLTKEGFEVVSFEAGEPALAALDREKPDVVLLDWMLPTMSGIEVAQAIRARKAYDLMPIVFVTAKDQQVDKLKALTTGADGFLTKPFDSMELLLSVRSFLRLTSREAEVTPGPMEGNGLKLDPARFIVTVDGEEVSLTRVETALLRHLMMNADAVFSADELARALLDNQGGARTVDAIHAHVRNVRAKIEDDPRAPQRLVTVGRKGYSFSSGRAR